MTDSEQLGDPGYFPPSSSADVAPAKTHSPDPSTCTDGQRGPCETTCGSVGERACGADGRFGACVPPAEICGNGEDDDCDGVVDNGCGVCRFGDGESCTTSCGSMGKRTCDARGEWGGCQPPAEVCGNGHDDNCDGRVDEGCAVCESGEERACTTTCGSTGRQVCGHNGEWGGCVPPAEVCRNGADDNCDGRVDEGCGVCQPGARQSCTTSCGSVGQKTCGENGEWGGCVPPAEVCGNGVDDNCDGHVDEGCQVCTPGTRVTCTSSCGTVGEKVCSTTGLEWGGCTPPAEVCGNGRDDNCDGRVDEGCPVCTPGARQTCTTGCGSQSEKTCDGSGQWGPCRIPPEICGNGIDDNCDGRVDEGCVTRCEDSIGGHCGGNNPGYGDKCGSQHNTGGCSADRFWAWCNRRNPEYPDIWYNFLSNWVDQRCDGSISLVDHDGDGYYTFTCTASSGMTYMCSTPLVLSFAGAPVSFSAGAHSFALDPSAGPACFDWPTAATPWLALDRDGSGAIEDGRELFGSATPLVSGARASNGFEALAELDDNGDGRVDPRDASWLQLLAWFDEDGDGVSQPDELFPVGELGLAAISLSYGIRVRCDERGNCERERAAFWWRGADGREHEGAVIDVHVRGDVGCGERARLHR
jgi:hypothetical protein